MMTVTLELIQINILKKGFEGDGISDKKACLPSSVKPTTTI
jgi:hypothetical protein